MLHYFIIDQPKNCSTLKFLLEEHSWLRFNGSEATYDEGLNSVLKVKPNIVFVNIDTIKGGLNSLVREISQYLDEVPHFIAISKSRAGAYDAFKEGFIDYFLNPFKELEIRKSVHRFKTRFDVKINKTLCINSYKDYQYLNTDDIIFLKADNNTTDFYLNDGSVVSAYKTLKIFEGLLPDNFYRIHKSYVINKNYVSRINHGKGRCNLKTHPDAIPFTKTYKCNIEDIKSSLTDISISALN